MEHVFISAVKWPAVARVQWQNVKGIPPPSGTCSPENYHRGHLPPDLTLALTLIPNVDLKSLNRVPATAGVRARMSPLSGGRYTVISYGT